jgi:hypothetical protein
MSDYDYLKYMIKYICLKDCEAFSRGFFQIKIGEIVELWEDNFIWQPIPGIPEEDIKSQVCLYDGKVTIIEYKTFESNFISLAEWENNK